MSPSGLPSLDLPKVIGHRGASRRAPENTLAGIRMAARLGIAWVEFDVRLTADGVPVLFHDAMLERTTNGCGAVVAHGLEPLRRLDAGAWFGPAFRGERIPTLKEAIEVLDELGLGANVEIKPEEGRGAEAGRAVLSVLARHWPRKRPYPVVSSFDWSVLATIAAEAPGWPLGLLMARPHREWRAWANRVKAATIHCGARGLDKRAISTLKRARLPLVLYTVNGIARARQLLAWGADSLISDVPDRLLAAV
ncbi:MAG: glycerophosphodiester phosphodiesterase family protein [Alphaproteobacteria bacterium]